MILANLRLQDSERESGWSRVEAACVSEDKYGSECITWYLNTKNPDQQEGKSMLKKDRSNSRHHENSTQTTFVQRSVAQLLGKVQSWHRQPTFAPDDLQVGQPCSGYARGSSDTHPNQGVDHQINQSICCEKHVNELRVARFAYKTLTL